MRAQLSTCCPHLLLLKDGPVCFNQSSCSMQPTAEIALCMMLMLARRVDEARDMFRDRQIGKPAGNQVGRLVLAMPCRCYLAAGSKQGVCTLAE